MVTEVLRESAQSIGLAHRSIGKDEAALIALTCAFLGCHVACPTTKWHTLRVKLLHQCHICRVPVISKPPKHLPDFTRH